MIKKDTYTKLKILSQAAEFDNVCTGSGKRIKINTYNFTRGLGGIHYVWLSNGKCFPLLKVLYTNFCINNCKYCYHRRKNDIRRTSFTPKELAELTTDLYRKGHIKGLFLSSGIYPSSDDTMEQMIKTVEILRRKHGFKAYIHLKILPGTSEELIKKAILLANRVSCNIELPTQESLKRLAPDKEQKSLVATLAKIKSLKEELEKESSTSTQLIIGVTPDTDKTILKLSQNLYKKDLVKRVYYSAYIPVNRDKDLPSEKPPYLREYRLYQADWLLRFYGFSLEELFDKEENLDIKIDPKLRWALSHPEFFPVEITKADYWELIKVPGIGPTSAKRLIEIRKKEVIGEEALKRLRISLKKVTPFITIRGKTLFKGFRKIFIEKKTTFENYQSFLKVVMNSAKYFEISKIKELSEILLKNPFIGILIYREKYIYANPFICELLEYTQEEFSQLKPEDIIYFEKDKKRVREIAKRRSKGERFLMTWKDMVLRTKRDKKVYALVSSITVLYEGKPSGLLMIIDITKKVRIEKLLKMLREINQKLVEVKSEKEFFNKISKILTDTYGMRLIWIGVPDYETRLIKPVYSFGVAVDYLKKIKVSMEESVPEGRGPVGRAFREDKIQIIADTETDPKFSPWRKPALKLGLRSVAAIPIKIEDEIKYVLALYADEPSFFEEENREILEELKRDLEFGIKKLELFRREKIFAETLRNLEEVVISLNQEGTIMFINEKGSKILGFSQDKLIGKPIEILGFKFKGENLANFFKARLDKPLRIPVSIETSKGTLWFDMKINAIKLDEEFFRYILIAEDVSKILEFEDMLDKARFMDPLTKLLNYEGFRKRVKNIFPFISEEGALIIVDLCDFTYINTMFGHEGGNFCLEEIARRLEPLKNKGLVSRAFSDTFVVFFYHLKDKRQIFEILKTLKDLISEPMKLKNETVKIDFNAGVAIFPQDGKSFEELWKNANLALNEAKRKGKGTVEFYSSLIGKKIDIYFKSESLVKRAFEEELFVFYYQPYFDVNTLKIAGLEALVRIKEKDGTLHLPSEFLEYLENSPYLRDFEEWGIKTLEEKILKWKISISFNISGKSSVDLDFAKRLTKRFRSKQFFSNLIIEITERVIVQNVEEIKELVKFFKSQGIKVALDDFGIGYSSLSYLKEIPFDILKIDRIFIKEMLKSRKEIALIKNMIDIGHSFDMKVLAEGVETKEQLQYLDIMGCDYVQGFYLAKPMPEEEIEKLLTTK